ncbi:virulence factor Mce-like protein [Crossiella equi]|uniref:Virulence factor Mce-like protein n=1 Tax=Crossiella equi TaxID=130796 RepID=A0ABS5A8Z8_9PSEU|nr:MCE family protein [Crossiella equi]MBP2473047.1 virulence factor Mce-like protein [Crossiella equi]
MSGDLSRRGAQLLGLVFLLVVALFPTGSVAVYRKAFTPVATVLLEVERAGTQLRAGADVKVRGLVVGEVREIRAAPEHAVLALALDPERIRDIPEGVTARLLPKTLFGERYVALQPPAVGSGRSLVDGARIGLDRSAAAVEVEKLLDDLLPVLSAVRPDQLSATLTALATALDDKGRQLGDTLARLGDYLTGLEPALPDLRATLTSVVTVADTYTTAAPDLLRALSEATTTTRTVLEQQHRYRALLGSVTTTAVDTEAFLAANRDNLINLVDAARPTLDVLAKYAPEYPCLLKQLVDIIPDAERAFGKGSREPGIAKFTLEITASRGKYRPGVDTPKYLDQRGPRCYPVARAPNRAPQYPPGGPVKDGSTFPASVAGSPAERDLISALLAPMVGKPVTEVPTWASLALGPSFRGAEVSLR